MIDLDCIEYCHWCNEVICLVEAARDVGQAQKCALVTTHIAQKLNVPAYIAFWRKVGTDAEIGTIDRFRVRRINPVTKREIIMSPEEFARLILSHHVEHEKRCTRLSGTKTSALVAA
jgi:hypothetical protein